MVSNNDSLSERTQSCYQQLAAAAAKLNTVSDELGKSIETLNEALKRLNLGVSAWVAISSGEAEDGSYASDDVGYGKIEGKWGIALRSVSGNYRFPEGESVEAWLFNDAPRSLRIAAIGMLPDLLEKLTREAEATAKKVTDQLEHAQSVSGAISSLLPKPTARRK